MHKAKGEKLRNERNSLRPKSMGELVTLSCIIIALGMGFVTMACLLIQLNSYNGTLGGMITLGLFAIASGFYLIEIDPKSGKFRLRKKSK